MSQAAGGCPASALEARWGGLLCPPTACTGPASALEARWVGLLSPPTLRGGCVCPAAGGVLGVLHPASEGQLTHRAFDEPSGGGLPRALPPVPLAHHLLNHRLVHSGEPSTLKGWWLVAQYLEKEEAGEVGTRTRWRLVRQLGKRVIGGFATWTRGQSVKERSTLWRGQGLLEPLVNRCTPPAIMANLCVACDRLLGSPWHLLPQLHYVLLDSCCQTWLPLAPWLL